MKRSGFAPIVVLLVAVVVLIVVVGILYYVSHRLPTTTLLGATPTSTESAVATTSGVMATTSSPVEIPGVISAPTSHIITHWEAYPQTFGPIANDLIGLNNSILSLSHAVIDEVNPRPDGSFDSYSIQLYFLVRTERNEFCTDYFQTSLRLLRDEEGDLLPPENSISTCVAPTSTGTVEAIFDISSQDAQAIQNRFIIQAFDSNANLENFFTLTPQDTGNIDIEYSKNNG